MCRWTFSNQWNGDFRNGDQLKGFKLSKKSKELLTGIRKSVIFGEYWISVNNSRYFDLMAIEIIRNKALVCQSPV